MTETSPPSSNLFPIVVLISGSGSNLQAIIDAARSKKIPVDIRAVISNVADAYGLERAQRANIPTEVIDHTLFDNREAFDSALQSAIDSHQPKLVVLAGFMRLLTDEFVNHYRGRMLNIHPSLLPNFKGLHTHQRALDAFHDGEINSHGASVHFVTPELDGGPIILQAEVPIKNDDSTESLAARVLVKEHQIYPRVIGWIAEGRLSADENRVYFDSKPLEQPLSLDQLSPNL